MAGTRGGKRPNAGRKPKLDPVERLLVGAECERRWTAPVQEQVNNYFDEVTEDYREATAKAHAIPLDKRLAWLGSDDFAQYRADIEIEREFLNTSPRNVSIKRPFTRSDVILSVREAWQGVHGQVSISTITRCWEEYRALRKRLAEDDHI